MDDTGGGIDRGERVEDAARRELFEETGLQVEDLGAVVSEREVSFEFESVRYRQQESFFAVRTARFTPTRERWTDVEQRSLSDMRWWEVGELATTADVLYPENLVELVVGLTRPETDTRR